MVGSDDSARVVGMGVDYNGIGLSVMLEDGRVVVYGCVNGVDGGTGSGCGVERREVSFAGLGKKAVVGNLKPAPFGSSPAVKSAAAFGFGQSSTPTPAVKPAAFGFGQSSTPTPGVKPAAFGFGQASSTPAASGFSFGAPKTATPTIPAPMFGGTGIKTAEPVKSTSLFGVASSTTAAPAFRYGVPKTTACVKTPFASGSLFGATKPAGSPAVKAGESSTSAKIATGGDTVVIQGTKGKKVCLYLSNRYSF